MKAAIVNGVVLNATTSKGLGIAINATLVDSGDQIVVWATNEVLIALMGNILTTTKSKATDTLCTLALKGATINVEFRSSGEEVTTRNGSTVEVGNDHYSVVLKGLTAVENDVVSAALDFVHAQMTAMPAAKRDTVSLLDLIKADKEGYELLVDSFGIDKAAMSRTVKELLVGFYSSKVEPQEILAKRDRTATIQEDPETVAFNNLMLDAKTALAADVTATASLQAIQKKVTLGTIDVAEATAEVQQLLLDANVVIN